MTDLEIPVEVAVEIAFGADPESNPLSWVWTDVTDDVKALSGVTHRLGRPDEQSQIQASALGLVLGNETGDYTPDNPASQYYPNVELNTPIRFTPQMPDVTSSTYVLLEDDFERTQSTGWGQPVVGARWFQDPPPQPQPIPPTATPFARASVDGWGRVSTIDTEVRMISPVLFRDGDIRVTVSNPQAPGGQDVTARVEYRGVAEYRLHIVFLGSGDVDLELRTAGGEIAGSATGVATYDADDEFRIRIQVDGVEHRVRLWEASDPEPGTWDIDTTHSGNGQGWVPGWITLGLLGGGFASEREGLVLNGSSGTHATTPDHASLDITGDLDIRVEFTPEDLFSSNQYVVAKYTTSAGLRAYALRIISGAVPQLLVSEDGTAALTRSATAPLTTAGSQGSRFAVRVTLDADNGSGGHDVTFYTSDSIDGPWTQLGAVVTTAGTLTLNNSSEPLSVGSTSSGTTPFTGVIHAVEVRDGIDGTVVADPDFTAQTPGTTVFTDDAGREWTLQGNAAIIGPLSMAFDDVHVESPLFPWVGVISEWQPEWPEGDLSDPLIGDVGYARVVVSGGGPLRRLLANDSPTPPAITGTMLAIPRTVAHWPLTDEADATEFASAIDGAPAMQFAGDVQPSTATGPPGSPNVASVHQGATYNGAVPDAGTGSWSVGCLFRMDEGLSGFRTALHFQTSDDDFFRWRVRLNLTHIRVEVANADGDVQFTDDTAFAGVTAPRIFNRWLWVVVECETVNSTTVSYRRVLIDAETGFPTLVGAFVSRSTGQAGRVARVVFGPSGSVPDTGRQWGYFTVLDSVSGLLFNRVLRSLQAFQGETVGQRMIRLADETDAQFTFLGDVLGTEEMGPQGQQSLISHLQEGEDVDGGILFETPWNMGLTYRSRESLEQQKLHMMLDADPHDVENPPDIHNPFIPVLDDRDTMNDVTVERTGGSSARAVDEAHVVRHGRYSETLRRNVARDGQLRDIATWRLHTGTWPGMRYRSVTPDLNRNPHLLGPWFSMMQGDRLQVINLPPQHNTEPVELLTRGNNRLITPTSWSDTANTSPGGPFLIGALAGDDDFDDDVTSSRIDSSRSHLGEDIDDAATSFDVVVPVQVPFNPHSGFESPDIVIMDDPPEPAIFDYSAFGNVTLVRSDERAFTGSWSGKFTPDGVTGNGGVSMYRHGPAVGEHLYEVGVWLYMENAPSVNMYLQLSFLRKAGDFFFVLQSLFEFPLDVVPGQWNRFTISATSHPLTTHLTSNIGFEGGIPSVDDVVFMDDWEIGVQGVPWIDDATYPQYFPFDITVGPERMTVTGVSTPLEDVEIGAIESATGLGGTYTCPAPAHSRGDLLVAFQSADVVNTFEMTISGGTTWQLLQDQNVETLTRIWWKIAGPSEPANYNLTQGGNADGVTAIVSVVGGRNLAPVSASMSQTGSGTSVETPSTVPHTGQDLEMRWAAKDGDEDFQAHVDFTLEVQETSNGFTAAGLYSRDLTSSGSTGVVAFDVSVAASFRTGHTVNVTARRDSVQQFTVTRSEPMEHEAGAPVRLYRPMRFSQSGQV